MIRVQSSGNWNKTRSFLNRSKDKSIYDDMELYGKMGVDALSNATPVDSGKTAASWYYIIKKDSINPGIEWHNRNLADNGTPVIILIQYGHGTGTGGYIQGRDFINPAILPIFEKIANDVWKKVTA